MWKAENQRKQNVTIYEIKSRCPAAAYRTGAETAPYKGAARNGADREPLHSSGLRNNSFFLFCRCPAAAYGTIIYQLKDFEL